MKTILTAKEIRNSCDPTSLPETIINVNAYADTNHY